MEKEAFDVHSLQTNKEIFKAFNEMYGLPVNEKPTLPPKERIENFKSIMLDEINEADEIINKFNDNPSDEEKLDILTELSDWLADIIWYTRSEATQHGIDIDKTLEIIKESNFSKLGPDGKPVRDERDYIVKGPNYFPPQPKIKQMLKETLSDQ